MAENFQIIEAGTFKVALDGNRRPYGLVTQLFLNYDVLSETARRSWNSTRLGRAINWIVFG